MHHSVSLTLLTDLYELTMMQGYYFHLPEERGVFDMFYRRQPFEGGYTIVAGISPLLQELEHLAFTAEDLAYLTTLGIFKEKFLQYLSKFSFRGSVSAVKEGAVSFPEEPLLQVEGTLMEAQLVESLVLNTVNYQTLIATKSSRIVQAASGRPVLEFGLRRAHGADGALSASRASFIGGASSTSNTLAGRLFGIPVSGTMAHSWVMSYDSELESFREYARTYPGRCVLLVDTYDTLRSGVPNAIRVFTELKGAAPPGMMGIRIDSGDMEYLSKRSRDMLDAAGHGDVKILVSSDLDEERIAGLLAAGAPIDAWGVGTRMVTGWNDPALTGVYKISARSNRRGVLEHCIKLSDQHEKTTNPGRKNIMRFFDDGGMMLADLIYLDDEEKDLIARTAGCEPVTGRGPAGEAGPVAPAGYSRAERLLTPVMRDGAIITPLDSLEAMRARRDAQMRALGDRYRRLSAPQRFPVYLSERLFREKGDLMERIRSAYPLPGIP